MKCHVFIATTQGLVAVQDIELIDDSDVMSIVCLNGTAQSLNISNAYHNFVKKGSGIIQKDFGGESYRVDVSGNIDHGNSWQLGFYIAHYLKFHNLLGNGDPCKGDKIFCFTGEINIKDKSVQNVAHISLKLKLAEPKLISWRSQGFDTQFILPVQDKKEAQKNLSSYEEYYSEANNIIDVIAILPIIKNELIVKNQKYFLLKHMQANEYKNIKIIACLILLGVLFVFYLEFHQLKRVESSLVKFDERGITPDLYENKKHDFKPYLLAYVRKSAYLNSDFNKCDTAVTPVKIFEKNERFKSLDFEKLCELYFAAPKNTKQVIFFAKEGGEVINLILAKQGWVITFPNKLKHDLHYYLLSLADPITEEKQALFISEIEKSMLNHRVSYVSVSGILKRLSINATIFQHKMMTF